MRIARGTRAALAPLLAILAACAREPDSAAPNAAPDDTAAMDAIERAWLDALR